MAFWWDRTISPPRWGVWPITITRIFKRPRRTIAETSRAKGLGAGIYFAESPEKESMARDLGYHLMIAGCDWSLIKDAYRLRT